MKNDDFRIDLSEEELNVSKEDAWADVFNEFEQWEMGEKEKRKQDNTPIPTVKSEQNARPATPREEPQKQDAPAPAPAPEPASPRHPSMKRYEELTKKKSIALGDGDIDVISEFCAIIGKVNELRRHVQNLENNHPDYVPERFIKLWQSNLRETSEVMMKEFHELRNGRKEKKYNAKHICKKCHSVFLMPLPGGVCDECRAAAVTKPRSE